MTDFALLPPQEEKDNVCLEELLAKLHRNVFVTPSLVTAIAKHASSLGESICKDYNDLNKIIIRHEATIRKRWLKKTQVQRRDILLKAWPNMPQTHRPDYTEVNGSLNYHKLSNNLRECLGTDDKKTPPSASKIWPFINLEDLTKPKSLLIFLNTRGRNVPSMFTLTEEVFSPLAVMSMCSYELELDQYSLQVSNETTPGLYVKMSPVDKAQDPSQPSESKLTECPRRGIHHLFIQHKIIAFLAVCSKLILHDMDHDMLYCSAIQEEPPSSELELPSDLGFTTFADTLMVAPYRNRGSVEFLRLRAYFDALCTNAKDHILALREDPSYFADAFKDICEHSSGLILDCYEQISPQVDSKCFLMCNAAKLVTNAYSMFFSWRELYHMADLLSKTSMQNQRGDFATLLTEFNCTVGHVFKLIYQMLECASMSPNVRKYYIRAGSHIIMQRWKIRSLEEFQLMSSFECFNRGEDSEDVEGAALYLLLDHVTKIMQENKAARDLVSPRVSELFAQMSVIGECAMQLSVWCGTPQGSSFDLSKPHPHAHRNGFYEWLDHLDHGYMPVHLINPFRGKLDYPAYKARNPKTVRAMREAEDNLDKFWAYVDNSYKRKTGISQHEVIRKCIAEGGPMQRTPAWEDHVKSKSIQSEQLESIYQPFSGFSHNRDMQITGAFDRLAVVGEKIKAKTKGSPESVMGVDVPQTHMCGTDDEENVPQVFMLDKRALKVMKTLFHVPQFDHDDLPKGVKWHEFKRAMAHIGFAVEKLQGSAWQFTPGESLHVRRAIQFHEPHPVSDITYIMAKRFGRRLERVYGWNSASFRPA
ncbi:hypothetical protein J3E72DRAFT_374361 [Bipolaris maydis]|nr:hypothetical protein J3E72DRAFT_374361 [Bipolaris maydis]